DDAERIRRVREMSRTLVTIGACATAGGVQALRNFADVGEFTSVVYARPDYISTLATSTPIAAHVDVDFELHGCPIDRRQLLEVITALLVGRKPNIPAHSVCFECKQRGNVCVVVAHGTPCLGPVTHAGCAPCARLTIAAATAVSGRWRHPTRAPRWDCCGPPAWTRPMSCGPSARSTAVRPRSSSCPRSRGPTRGGASDSPQRPRAGRARHRPGRG